jgi:uncharacterized protein YprB with RNaseH-like and TPR domain
MNLFQRLNDIKKRAPAPDQPLEKEAKKKVFLPEARELNLKFGKCLLLEEIQDEIFEFPQAPPDTLLSNLKLIKGIGPVTESKLCSEGYISICHLTEHPRWGENARSVQDLIEARNVRELQRLGARDWELLSYFNREDVVFLDIESTGLWASQPLFLIGLLYHRDGKFIVNQFFARHYREEKAVLAAANEVIHDFKIVVSYNGKRFDMPYITGRSIEHRLFYSYPHYQIDMLYHARRRFSGLLPDCRLVTLEQKLLNFYREGDIPGYLIPAVYHRFARKQDAKMIKPVLEHNRLDLLAMARLFNIIKAGEDID